MYLNVVHELEEKLVTVGKTQTKEITESGNYRVKGYDHETDTYTISREHYEDIICRNLHDFNRGS